MIQMLEAIVDEMGKIRLLTEIRLEKSRRALVTILDDELKVWLCLSPTKARF